MFADALTYPVRKSGWIMILVGAIFASLLELLQWAPRFGLVVAFFSAGYFGAFYLDIVSTTMGEHEELPDWPSLTDFADDILSPFLRLVGLVLISFAPLLAVVLFAPDEAPWSLAAAISAAVFGCFYFPMAVLATQAFGGLGAALPHIVLPGIVRALPGYVVVIVALMVVFAACICAEEFASRVPYVGWFFGAAVALYGMMFQGRLIGLIYVEKRERLGWD